MGSMGSMVSQPDGSPLAASPTSAKPEGVRHTARVVLFSLGCALGAYGWVLRVVLPSQNSPHTRVEGVPHTRSTAPRNAPLTDHLVMIVVDGLGEASALAVPEIAELAERGAFRRIEAEYPSFTSPNVVAMMTGQPPRESGIRLNGGGSGSEGLDDVLACAADAGFAVRVRSRILPSFAALARPPHDADVAAGRAAAVFAPAMDALEPRRPRFELVHFGEVDDAGHARGRTSPAYRESAAAAGRFVAASAARLDPARDLLLVLSDHGHVQSGGHGGIEPDARGAFFLAWGASVEPGRYPARPMRDVASTITLAIGAATPSSNLGAPMFDLFRLSDASRESRLAELREQAAYGCRVEATAGCDALAEPPGDAEAQLALLSRLSDERDRGAELRERALAARRGDVGLLVGLALSIAASRPRLGLWPARAGRLWAVLVALFVGYAAPLAALGYRPTMSKVAGASAFLPHASAAVLCSALAALLVAKALRVELRAAPTIVVAAAALPLAAYVGAATDTIGPPLASPVLFLGAPLMVAAALTSIAATLLPSRA